MWDTGTTVSETWFLPCRGSVDPDPQRQQCPEPYLRPAGLQALGWSVCVCQAAREPLACRACVSVSPGSGSPLRFCRGRRQLSCHFCVCSGVGSPAYGEPSSSGRDDNFISPAKRNGQVWFFFWGGVCACVHKCSVLLSTCHPWT